LAQPHSDHPVAVAVRTPEIIAVGASAGGPRALGVLLGGFPAKLPVPIVVSQHIPHEFVVGLARWLEKHTALTVQVAADSMILEPGVVNLSPGTAHLTVVRQRSHLVARLVEEQGNHRYQPSVNALFESVATACGEAAVGLVLTGMGDDGATGLTAMRQAGARTFAQDKRTATVFGMPGAAIERGAVERVLPLEKLSSAVMSVF
jgi:two-component system chemotaxis response regulator CheB